MKTLSKHRLQLLGIAKSWACKSLPGWDDLAHRDLIGRHGAKPKDGRVSATTMTAPMLDAALDDYAARGWPRVRAQHQHAISTQRVTKPVPPHIGHIVRLWGRLGEAKLIDTPTRPALLKWCERQVMHTVPNLDVLTVPECQKITEALKAWVARA
jgi:hypothetical protein